VALRPLFLLTGGQQLRWLKSFVIAIMVAHSFCCQQEKFRKYLVRQLSFPDGEPWLGGSQIEKILM